MIYQLFYSYPYADSYVILHNSGNRFYDISVRFLPPFIFPQGGKVLAPSPVGEVPIVIGREGGIIFNNIIQF